jgi:hypothetical protein
MDFDLSIYQNDLLQCLVKPLSGQPDILYIDECIKDVIHDTFLVQSNNYYDEQWYIESVAYTQSLTGAQKHTLRAYSHHANDVVNPYLRTNTLNYILFGTTTYDVLFASQLFVYASDISSTYFTEEGSLTDIGLQRAKYHIGVYNMDVTKPQYNKTLLRGLLISYINDLSTIISNAPRLRKNILTFRGVAQDYLQGETTAIEAGFISTSYLPEAAYSFKGEDKCCMYEYVISVGTHCIAMSHISDYPKEREILIQMKQTAIIGQLDERFYLNPVFLETNRQQRIFLEVQHLLQLLLNPLISDDKDRVFGRRIIIAPPTNSERNLNLRQTRKNMRGGAGTIRVLTPEEEEEIRQSVSQYSPAKTRSIHARFKDKMSLKPLPPAIAKQVFDSVKHLLPSHRVHHPFTWKVPIGDIYEGGINHGYIPVHKRDSEFI